MSRVHRSALNLITSMLMMVISTLVGLVSARLLVRWLGAAALGTYTAAGGWLGQLALLEFGVAGALAPVLSRAAASGDQAQIRAALASSVKPYLRIAALCLVGAVILNLIITKLMAVPPGHVVDVRVGMAVASIGFMLLPLNPLRILADASQRGYVINFILMVQSLAITALSLLFAWANWGITGQFVAGLIGLLVYVSSVVWDAEKRVPGFSHLLFEKADPAITAELRRLNRPALIYNVTNRLGLLTDNLVVAFFFGPAAVTPFFYAQKLCLLVQTQLQSVGGATWAALTELAIKGERELLSIRMIQLTRLVSVIGFAGILPIVAYNRAFFALWQPRLQYPGQVLTVLASFNAVALAIVTLWSWFFNGAGKVAKLVPLATTAAVVNTVVSVVAGMGGLLYGPVLGSTICLLCIQMWWLPLVMRREYGIEPAKLFQAVVYPLVLALPCGALVIWASDRWEPRHWTSLALDMGLSAFGLLLLYYWLLFSTEERRNLQKQIGSFLPRAAALAPQVQSPATVSEPVPKDAADACNAEPIDLR